FFFFFFSLPLCFSLFPYTTLFRSSSLFSFSLLFSDVCDLDPSDRGGVREHPGERTRTGGIEPARYRTPEMVQASAGRDDVVRPPDRKSTRLNSSHEWISYAVFCLK